MDRHVDCPTPQTETIILISISFCHCKGYSRRDMFRIYAFVCFGCGSVRSPTQPAVHFPFNFALLPNDEWELTTFIFYMRKGFPAPVLYFNALSVRIAAARQTNIEPNVNFAAFAHVFRLRNHPVWRVRPQNRYHLYLSRFQFNLLIRHMNIITCMSMNHVV